jgi:hypothetical protein
MSTASRSVPKAHQGSHVFCLRQNITASRIHENSSEQDKGVRENRLPHSLPYTSPQPEDKSDEGMVRMVRILSVQGTLLRGIGVLGMAGIRPSAFDTWSSQAQRAVV